MEKQRREVILGIDTGGTFTDGIVMEKETERILAKAKANTTRQDLSIGIGNCIEQLNLQELDCEISLVCLSTTLATNSVVEGKRFRIGLITTGSEMLKEDFKVEKWAKISGKIEIDGDIKEELNEQEIFRAVDEMKGKVDSLVISGYACVRNPVHELRIKEIARKQMDVPIVCAHELSMSLGFNERTATAVINAQLIPIVTDLLKKMKLTLERKKIRAKIVMMKGDGTMMLESHALERPVETVLSGPAASVVGGAALTDEKDALVVDLGGTTMDIADMNNGRALVSDEGATIDGWETKVKAVNIHTFGLGGDSRLKKGRNGFYFGPEKAMPICYANSLYPYLAEEICQYAQERALTVSGCLLSEALLLNPGAISPAGAQSGMEQKIVQLLSDGPHSAAYLGKHLSSAERSIGFRGLLARGILTSITITPTDLLHAAGEYSQWDRAAAEACLKVQANYENCSERELLETLMEKFQQQMTFSLIKSGFAFDGEYNPKILESTWIWDALFGQNKRIHLKGEMGKNLVALGAPAAAWLTRLARPLGTKVIVPPLAEVANAVGAAKGLINEDLEILIRYDPRIGRYRVYMPWEMVKADTVEEARNLALDEIEKYSAKLRQSGEYTRTVEEETVHMAGDLEQIYELKLNVMLSSRPDCLN